MKRYPNRVEFRESIAVFCSQHGFKQRYLDESRIQAIQERHIAISFALAILSVAVETEEISKRDGLQKVIRKTIEECQSVLKDDSVYIMDDSENSTNSKLLEVACGKATEAVSHAGNLCNNDLAGIFSGTMQEIILQARDMCDLAKKRTIGDC